MTVQRIGVTQVCGKCWNFRAILCKLLILSGEVTHLYTLKPDSHTAVSDRLTACSTLNLLRRHGDYVKIVAVGSKLLQQPDWTI